jgi:acetylornithine/succinyldiaminopimelate/putrescine aminotransferase
MSDLATTHRAAVGAPPELERCPLMPTYGAPTVQFVRGEGAQLWDRHGRRYLDFLSGLAVTSLGHAHPAVAEAVAAQARRLVHVSNLFATEHNAPLALTLDRLITGTAAVGQGPHVAEEAGPAGAGTAAVGQGPHVAEEAGAAGPRPGEQQGQVFFANSGAEANECAIKLARRFGGRGRHVVVSALQSFHGRTLATLHATGQPAKWEVFQPLPEGFRHVPWADLAELEQALDGTVAAVLLEPVQGEGGVNPAPPEYFAGVRRLCDERGILFMVDEVQTGLARTGEWFGFQHFGVRPDVVTMAKALGNGVPIGACWARTEVAAAFEPGDHATTFGGQPLATAAARAVLATMEAMDAPAVARERGGTLAAALGEVAGVAAVRGLGLLLAAELDEGVDARAVAARCLDAGLVLNAVTASALRLAPPLVVDDHQVAEAAAIVAAAVAEVAG